MPNDVITVELLHADAQLPRRATKESAGYDLFAHVSGRTVKCSDGQRVWEMPPANDATWLELPPGVCALVPLGFKARLPAGYEAQVRPRSGTSFKKGLQIPNAPGTIDADYPDEWMVPVKNPMPWPVRIEHGERIAQMILGRYSVLDFVEGAVSATTDRSGGFGSTGHR